MNFMQDFALAGIASWSELVVTGSSETCQGSLSGRLWAAAGAVFALNLRHACAALL